MQAGLAEVDTDVVVVLAGDLPFLTAELVRGLRERLTGDGVLVVDDTGRDQYLLGAWRTTALRDATARVQGPTSLRRVLGTISVRRWRPDVRPGDPPPWLDCDTPADLARARAIADGHLTPGSPPEPAPPRPGVQEPPSLLPRFQAPHEPG
ncbi:NTP transferase domain-containing protein [Blastococcus brunescens]|uniref:NTP transferase domain-containing protein n=1 Tax=Blastococcus brunescens TaxID=1564165 RepID=A0ABZ1AX73_9ACTN|nr:NTP transferase domain-containing protein [Blastococcus sp. BMG 8361]WRL63059.1 NTP transferase domain-containing protein [Blastococcus sp. BMG 8361]